jgi:aspartate racemase
MTILGILGGLGPMSTVYFYEMLTDHTKADRDQDHIDILISSKASTPDRTAFILGNSDENPIDSMTAEIKRLTDAGASLIVIPCNTAHYFYDKLASSCNVPIINIIEETAKFCASRGMKRVGILATEGTVSSGTYKKYCKKYGIDAVAPSPEGQKIISSIIYDRIKKNLDPDMNEFFKVCDELGDCDTLILGCTELSLLKKSGKLDRRFTDSLEVLSFSTIVACGKTPIGYDFI